MWIPDYIEPITAISTCILGFIGYYLIVDAKLFHTLFTKKLGEDKTLVWWVVFQRLTGVIFLGVIPAIIVSALFSNNLIDYGFTIVNSSTSYYWMLGAAVFIIPMNLIMAGKPGNLKVYPQIRTREWNISLIFVNAISWAAYLLAYELLFRGILLFSCERALGALTAIAINTAIYSLVHIPKGIKETLGAIPFGIFLCIITLYTGNIWVAVFVHVILALSNDYIAIYANPNMYYKIKISNNKVKI